MVIHLQNTTCVTESFFKNWDHEMFEISKVKFGQELQAIKSMGFMNSHIIEIDLSDCKNLKNIEEHAFQQCGSLKKVILPKHITELPRYAFFGLNNLVSVSGSDLSKFYKNTFEGCDNLETIQISSNLSYELLNQYLSDVLNISEYKRGRSGIIIGSDDSYSYIWSFTDFRFYFSKKINCKYPCNLVSFIHDYSHSCYIDNKRYCRIDRSSYQSYKATSVSGFDSSFLNKKYRKQVIINTSVGSKNIQQEAIEILKNQLYTEKESFETIISNIVETVNNLDIEKLISSYSTSIYGETFTKVGGDDTHYETIYTGTFYDDPYIETLLPSYYSKTRESGYTSNWGPSSSERKLFKENDEKKKEYAKKNYDKNTHIMFLIDNYLDVLTNNKRILEQRLRIKFAKAIFNKFYSSNLKGQDLINEMNSYISFI